MNTKARNAAAHAIGAFVMTAGLVFAARSRLQTKPAQSTISAVPAHASAVLTLNVPRLRASAFGQAIFGSETAAPLSSSVIRICGFDPILQVQEFGLWIAPNQLLGLVATGPLDEQSLANCATKVMRDRKGDPRSDQRSGFTVVRDAKLGEQSAQIAVRNNGPSLLGQPAALEKMLQRLSQKDPETTPHMRLREQQRINSDAVLTVVIGEELRAQIRQAAGQSTSFLTGVVAIVASLELSERSKLHAQISCESAEPCEMLAKFLMERRSAARESIPMRLAGVAGLLDDTKIEARAGQLTIEASAPTQEIARVFEKLQQWLLEAEDHDGAPSRKLPLPDETLRP